ncbi:MAG: TIGR03086 family metal-binding protein [Actinomycetes bacterium]
MAYDKTVFLPLDTHAAFELVTQPERLRRWKTVAARIDLQVGGDYRWTITPGHSAMGSVLELEAGKRMIFSWGWEGSADLPPGASTVTITLEPTTGGTNLRLVHDGLNAEQEVGHGEGWSHYLDRLVAFVQNGAVEADPWSYAPDPIDEITSAEAALSVTERTLYAITNDDLSKPTPCAGMNVGQMVDHLFFSISNVAQGLGIDISEHHDLSPEERIANLAQTTLEALRQKPVDEIIDLGFTKLPAQIAAALMSMEILVHGWDIASAIGVPFAPSAVLSNYVNRNAHLIINDRVRQSGLFGPEIPTSDATESLQKLLAFTGREPVSN